MLTRIRRMIRWLTDQPKLSPEDIKWAGVHLGRLRGLMDKGGQSG
jgi:hypothetical protein